MTAITETSVKKYWAVVSLAVFMAAGASVWATKVNADINSLSASVDELRDDLRNTARELRWLRESMIAAGTAKAVPAPKED
jgi:outer membrane murein-binding lipoprotein Lpp